MTEQEKSTTLPTPKTSDDKPRGFSDVEIQATKYFFGRLRTIYGAGKFNQQWPTEADLRLARREYAKEIGRHTKEEIDQALEHAKKQKTNGDPHFEWPDISRILAGAKRYACAAHREYLPPPPESEEKKQARLLRAEKGILDLKRIMDMPE